MSQFTNDDVKQVRWAADCFAPNEPAESQRLHAIADRIAALVEGASAGPDSAFVGWINSQRALAGKPPLSTDEVRTEVNRCCRCGTFAVNTWALCEDCYASEIGGSVAPKPPLRHD